MDLDNKVSNVLNPNRRVIFIQKENKKFKQKETKETKNKKGQIPTNIDISITTHHSIFYVFQSQPILQNTVNVMLEEIT